MLTKGAVKAYCKKGAVIIEILKGDVKSARRESLPIIQTERRGSLVSKHNPNRRLSHQEWDELKEEKMLAQAEKEAQGFFYFQVFLISCLRTREENRRKARRFVAAADKFETRNRNCSRKLKIVQIILQNKIQ